MKKRILSLLILLSATTATMAYNSLLAKLVKADYEGKADSLTKVFIKEFMNTSKGTFWVTPKGVNSSNTYIYRENLSGFCHSKTDELFILLNV